MAEPPGLFDSTDPQASLRAALVQEHGEWAGKSFDQFLEVMGDRNWTTLVVPVEPFGEFFGQPATKLLVAELQGRILALEEARRQSGDLHDPDEKQLGGFVRDSGTSRRAALDAYPRQGTQRWRILQELFSVSLYDGPPGATRDELAASLSMSPNTVRPRVVELMAGGWVEVLTTEGAPRVTWHGYGSERLRELEAEMNEEERRRPVTRKTTLGSDAEVLVLTEKGRLALEEKRSR